MTAMDNTRYIDGARTSEDLRQRVARVFEQRRRRRAAPHSGDPEWNALTIPDRDGRLQRAAGQVRADEVLPASSGIPGAQHKGGMVISDARYTDNLFGRSLSRSQALLVEGRSTSDPAVILRAPSGAEVARAGERAGLVVETPSQILPIYPTFPNFETSFFATAESEEDGGETDDDAARELGLTGDVISRMRELRSEVRSPLRRLKQRTYGGIVFTRPLSGSAEQVAQALGGQVPSRAYNSISTHGSFPLYAFALGHAYRRRADLPQIDVNTVTTEGDSLLAPRVFVSDDGVVLSSSLPYAVMSGGFLKKLAKKVKKVAKKVAKVVKKVVNNPVVKAIGTVGKIVASATPIGAAVVSATTIAKGVVNKVKQAKAAVKQAKEAIMPTAMTDSVAQAGRTLIAPMLDKAASGVKGSSQGPAPAPSLPSTASAATQGAANAPTASSSASPSSGGSVAQQVQPAAVTTSPGSSGAAKASSPQSSVVAVSDHASNSNSSANGASIESGVSAEISELPQLGEASPVTAATDFVSRLNHLTLAGDAAVGSLSVPFSLIRKGALSFLASLLQPAVGVAKTVNPDLYARLLSPHPGDDALQELASLAPTPNLVRRWRDEGGGDISRSTVCALVVPSVSPALGPLMSDILTKASKLAGLSRVIASVNPTPSPRDYVRLAIALASSDGELGLTDGEQSALQQLRDAVSYALSSNPDIWDAVVLMGRDSSDEPTGEAPAGNGPQDAQKHELTGDPLWAAWLGSPSDSSTAPATSSVPVQPSSADGSDHQTTDGSSAPAQEGSESPSSQPLLKMPDLEIKPISKVGAVPSVITSSIAALPARILAAGGLTVFIRKLLPWLKKILGSKRVTVSSLPGPIARIMTWLAKKLGMAPQELTNILVTLSISELLDLVFTKLSQASEASGSESDDEKIINETSQQMENADAEIRDSWYQHFLSVYYGLDGEPSSDRSLSRFAPPEESVSDIFTNQSIR